MKLVRWWEAHFSIMEFLLSILIGLSFALWSEFIDERRFLLSISADARLSIYGTMASLFGSLLGFNITAVSIVLGYSASDKLAVVRQSERYKDLWDVFKSAIRVLGVATVVSLVSLFIDKEVAPNLFVLYFTAFISVLSLFRVARCIWVLEKIIFLVTKDVR